MLMNITCNLMNYHTHFLENFSNLSTDANNLPNNLSALKYYD